MIMLLLELYFIFQMLGLLKWLFIQQVSLLDCNSIILTMATIDIGRFLLLLFQNHIRLVIENSTFNKYVVPVVPLISCSVWSCVTDRAVSEAAGWSNISFRGAESSMFDLFRDATKFTRNFAIARNLKVDA